MPPLATERQLERIATALGVSRDHLIKVAPERPPADWLFVDGAPDQFEIWADQVLDPQARLRLMKIATILNTRKRI